MDEQDFESASSANSDMPTRTNIILTYERRICKPFYDFENRTFGSLTEVIIYDNFRIHEHDL